MFRPLIILLAQSDNSAWSCIHFVFMFALGCVVEVGEVVKFCPWVFVDEVEEAVVCLVCEGRVCGKVKVTGTRSLIGICGLRCTAGGLWGFLSFGIEKDEAVKYVTRAIVRAADAGYSKHRRTLCLSK